MSTDLRNKRVLVTGGAGFLGSFVVDKLLERGAKKENLRIPRSGDSDLRRWENCVRAVEGIDIVIHLAASVGGKAGRGSEVCRRGHGLRVSKVYPCSL